MDNNCNAIAMVTGIGLLFFLGLNAPRWWQKVLAIAERVAQVPSDLQQINKRAVHRQMDAMGIRAGIRAGTEMQQLATFTQSTQAHLAELREGLTEALSKRDAAFGDYRTGPKEG